VQNRAYSMLDVKAIDEGRRIFSGVATTPTVDRVGDIIEPDGVSFKNPLPLLHQHFHDRPIGQVRFLKPTDDGIEFEAEIPRIDEPETLRERVDTAWAEIKHKLVRATSIGFVPIEFSFMDNGGIRYNKIEVYELSTVTIPANPDAVISSVKSMSGKSELEIIKALDAEARHRAGVPDPEIPLPPMPAALGKTARVVKLNPPPASRQPFVIREIRR
jgi:HK97 family phage prohead protease